MAHKERQRPSQDQGAWYHSHLRGLFPDPLLRRDTMPPSADAATLNVQPRQRRDVYERLAALPTGGSVKDLLLELEIPEPELREALRKLDAAGLVRRMKGTWSAVPLETAEPEPRSTPEAPAQPESVD